MGKLILCAGQVASKPYCFTATGTNVYTIEELCYYIYHNIETVSEELMSPSLISFIREELGLAQRADFLENLVKNKAGIKDIVVSIFCSADYYDEDEIKKLLAVIDELYHMTPVQRKKRHADEYMKHGKFREALRGYLGIIHSKESQDLTHQEYGDMLHNLGVIDVYQGDYLSAAEAFREAYERNHRIASLKQYLFALKLGGEVNLFEREVRALVARRDILEQIERELNQAERSEEYTVPYHEMQKLKESLKNRERQQFYEMADEMIERLKEKYRRETI
ncbi:MAG: hypothetical protein E7256_01455 [Lachnospiraceae bacterium]|nr:hypothetical protein [Lachnospiraceae bacterium]